MYIYRISLNDNYYKLKNHEKYDILRDAIVVAKSCKDCREIVSKDLQGAEIQSLLRGQRLPKGMYKSEFNNNIWHNATYTTCRKIGVPLKSVKRGGSLFFNQELKLECLILGWRVSILE